MAEAPLDALCHGLDRAIVDGHLPDPAHDAIAATSERNAADSRAYIWALRTRLIALGYLGERDNRDAETIDARFVAAVRRFQRDIGAQDLVADGWAGPRTWRVLQALAGFEDAQHPADWGLGVDPARCPAVARAAYLRLWVMGFFDGWRRHRLRRGIDPTLDNPECSAALARFLRFARALGLPAPAQTPNALDLPTLSVLFGHDAIVAALASPRFVQTRDFEPQVEAIARIELWLHGYDCKPGPPDRRTRRRGPPGKRVKRPLRTQRQVVHAFRRDCGEGLFGASAGVDQALFAEFARSLEATESADPGPLRVARAVDALDDDMRQEFEQRLAGLASSIWDGVRRMARALWRVLQGMARATTAAINNLARLVARESRRYFHLVVRAVDVVQGRVDYMRHSLWPLQPPQHTLIWRGRDADHGLLLAPAPHGERRAVLARYGLRAARFRAAGQVIGALLDLLRGIASIASGTLAGPLAGPMAWLRALLALGEMRGAVAAIGSALATLDDWPVTGAHPGAVMRVDIA